MDFVYISLKHYWLLVIQISLLFSFTSQQNCTLKLGDNIYDLNGLRLENGQFWSVRGSIETKFPYTYVILNVCDKLNIHINPTNNTELKSIQNKCSKDSSVCAFNNITKEVTSLGLFNNELTVTNFSLRKNHLRLVYTNGDICKDNKNKTTIINFICDRNSNSYAGLDLPRLTHVSSDLCEHEIYWRTTEACIQNRYTSQNCTIDGYFDLNQISSQNEYFEAEHNHDLDSDDSEDTNNNKYAFQICGKRLSRLSQPYLTFWDFKSTFQFTQAPELIYDSNFLYFKYSNLTSEKYAFIKMECSYEESISCNSKKFDSLKIKDVNNSSVAFVLWKTKHACLRGSSGLNSHFEKTNSNDCVFPKATSSLFNVNTELKFVDLRILLKKYQAEEKDLTVFVSDSIKFYTRLCASSYKCSHSFGCLVINATRSINLGSNLSSSQFLDNDLRLVYDKGDMCTPEINYSFEILLKCWDKQDNYLTFIRQSKSGCHYHFEWLTSHVCTNINPDKKINQSCKLNYDESFSYDFEQLNYNMYETSEQSGPFQISVCRSLKQNECNTESLNVSSCFNKKISQGMFNDKLNEENGLVSLTYSNGEKCPQNQMNSSTLIEFFCEYNENNSKQVDYLYFLESKCQNVLGLYTYLACPPYLNRQSIDFKCFVSFTNSNKSPLQSYFNVQKNSFFTFKFKNYRLIFQICSLLPNNLKLKSKNKCYDNYGNSLGSACLYDDLNAEQFNLGISKGPFISSYPEQIMTNFGEAVVTYYTLTYTQGDFCRKENKTQSRMELNLLFKCIKYSKSFLNIAEQHISDKMELIDLGDDCKINVQIEMESFCAKINELKENIKVEESHEKEILYDEKSKNYCTFTQIIDSNTAYIYNLSSLANLTYKLNDLDRNLLLKFRICHNIQMEQCNTEVERFNVKYFDTQFYGGGYCVVKTSNMTRNCLLTKANDHFIVIEDRYRIRLVYSAANSVIQMYKCQNQTDHLVIDFLCEPNSVDELSFKSFSNQNIYVEIKTKYACPKKISLVNQNKEEKCMFYPYFGQDFYQILHESTKNDEESNRLSGIIDLTESEYSYESQSSTKLNDPSIEFYFNLCPISKHINCDGAICLMNHTSSSSISLGKLNSAMLNKDKPEVMYYYQKNDSKYILFTNGSECKQGLYYSSEITLVCDQQSTKYEDAPQYFEAQFNSDFCRYFFIWKTPLVCLESTLIINKNISETLNECKIYNKLHNYTFDLNELKDSVHLLKTNSFEYTIGICSDISIERRNLSSNHSDIFGFNNRFRISHFTNHLLANYEGQICPSKPDRNRTVTILFECSPFADLDPILLEESDCDIIIKWQVKSACTKRYHNECKFYYAGNSYDLNPISHTINSWKIDQSNNNTYWINICQGILNGPNNCSNTASVCIYDPIRNLTEELSYVHQMHLEIEKDGALIDMTYNNSKRVCDFNSKFNTFVIIRLMCGQTIGRPKHVDSGKIKLKPDYLKSVPDECIYLFEWSTRYSCRNVVANPSTVDVKEGVVYDSAFDQIKIDMTNIFLKNKTFIGETDIKNDSKDSFKYFIQFKLPNLIEKCNNSLVCQLNPSENSFRDLGSFINSYRFDELSQILEVSIKSNSTQIESIIRFYCDLNAKGDSFIFETVSTNFVYLFDWPTPKLCVRNKLLQEKNELEQAHEGFVKNSMITTTLATATKSQDIYHANKIPAFVYLLLLLISIVILVLILNNINYFASFSIWSNINMCCFKLKNEVKWFGSSRRSHQSPMANIRGIKYNKRHSKSPKSQTYFQLISNEETNEQEKHSDEEEITALIDFNDQETVLKLNELPQSSTKLLLAKTSDTEKNIEYLPKNSKPKPPDTHNNKLTTQTDTDDDLINV